MIALDISLLVIAAVLGYAWVGYPWILALASQRASRRDRSSPGEDAADERPTVAVLLSAYNEESHIEARLLNLLGMEYPADKLFILVGCDGATDGTVVAASRIAREHPRVRVLGFPINRGKMAVLKDLVEVAGGPRPAAGERRMGLAQARAAGNERPGSEGGPNNADIAFTPPLAACRLPQVPDILVFTDANTLFAPDALAKLLRHFADPVVGGVCGRLVLESRVTTDHGPRTTDHDSVRSSSEFSVPAPSAEGMYWRWESRMKEWESVVDSCLGANGAIYAIRRELFWDDIPANTVVDDFVVGMKVRERGHRMLYEPAALAMEELPKTADEWTRRVRIGAGDFQALWLCRRCLMPRYGRFAWMFWSHKVLRWFTPHVLLALGGMAAYLQWTTGHGPLNLDCHSHTSILPYAPTLVLLGLAVLLALAALGRLIRMSGMSAPRLLCLCDHFVTMQAAVFAGFLRFCRGGLKGAWARTPRGSAGR